jgi:hypothetical protein
VSYRLAFLLVVMWTICAPAKNQNVRSNFALGTAAHAHQSCLGSNVVCAGVVLSVRGQYPKHRGVWWVRNVHTDMSAKYSTSWKPKRDADVDDKPLLTASTFVYGSPRRGERSMGSFGDFTQRVRSREVDDLHLRV